MGVIGCRGPVDGRTRTPRFGPRSSPRVARRRAARESAALYRGLGTPHSVPWCLEGLAGVAVARGEWERAAIPRSPCPSVIPPIAISGPVYPYPCAPPAGRARGGTGGGADCHRAASGTGPPDDAAKRALACAGQGPGPTDARAAVDRYGATAGRGAVGGGGRPPGSSRHQRARAVVATFQWLAGELRMAS